MSWRTPSYFIAAASASLSMTAWKAPMSETSMLRPTRPGFSGSTKVRISLATESNTSARLGTKANGRHRRLRGLRSDSACECPSFERFAGTQTSKDGTRRPRPAPREDGVKPGRTPVVPLPVVFAAGATRRRLRDVPDAPFSRMPGRWCGRSSALAIRGARYGRIAYLERRPFSLADMNDARAGTEVAALADATNRTLVP